VQTDRSVRDFCAELASGAPVPGGGAAAALAGALAAALASMTLNYTVGRRRFERVEAEMRALLSRAETIRHELLELVERDAEAYQSVVDAQGQARERSEPSAQRDEAVQRALADAVRVPLRAAVLAADVLALCEPIAERGNQRLISDVGVAALLADAALQAAGLNVRVNLAELRDAALESESRAALARLTASANEVRPRVMALVNRALG
jgi:formiminotetrahydrofolate cyclodeaminase